MQPLFPNRKRAIHKRFLNRGSGQDSDGNDPDPYSKRIRETYPNAFVRSPVSQNERKVKRYLYTNKSFTIIVWEIEGGKFIGFEIIFQDQIKEVSVRWKEGERVRISTVNTGTRTPFKNLSPTLNGSYDINWDDFNTAFSKGMEGVDAPVLQSVNDKVAELSQAEQTG